MWQNCQLVNNKKKNLRDEKINVFTETLTVDIVFCSELQKENLSYQSQRVMDKQVNISDFLGLRKSSVGMLFMVILVGMGERMAERFLPIYLIALGGGAISIGLLNGLDNLLSALYAFPGGYLSDRMGTKNALLVFNIIAMFGLYYLLRDSVVSIAAFGGALLWQIGPFTNFMVAFLFGVAGTTYFALYDTDFPDSG